ncbi:MAG: hypothetical protein Q9204_005110, partial [Flavoplaca sp. TL-2023a]
ADDGNEQTLPRREGQPGTGAPGFRHLLGCKAGGEGGPAQHLRDPHLDDFGDQSSDQPTWRDEVESAADRDHNRFEHICRIPRPRNVEAAEKYLNNFLRHRGLIKNTEGIVRCTIEASHDDSILEADFEVLRNRMVNQLTGEPSRQTWTAMLRRYCIDVAETGNKRLQDSFVNALLASVGYDKDSLRTLTHSEYFEDLRMNKTCAPVLVSLLIELMDGLH